MKLKERFSRVSKMDEASRKKAYELFYLVKGHLKFFYDDDLEAIIRDYTKRLWHNEEAHLYYEGFEEAYRDFIKIHRARVDLN